MFQNQSKDLCLFSVFKSLNREEVSSLNLNSACSSIANGLTAHKDHHQTDILTSLSNSCSYMFAVFEMQCSISQDSWKSVIFAMAGGIDLSLGTLATQYACSSIASGLRKLSNKIWSVWGNFA